MSCETREEPFTERFLLRVQSLRGDLNEKRNQLRMKTFEEMKKRMSMPVEHDDTLISYNSDEEKSYGEETDVSSPETVIMAKLHTATKISEVTSEKMKSNSRFYVSQSLSSCSSEESFSQTVEGKMKRAHSLHSSIDTFDGKYSDQDIQGSSDSILSLKGLRDHVTTNIMSYFKKRNKDAGNVVNNNLLHESASLQNVTLTHNIEPASTTVSSSSSLWNNIEKNDTDIMIHTLLKQISVQKACMIQSSKVLPLCKSNGSFCSSTEIAEAERSLLLATQKYQTLLAEIHRLQFLENPKGQTYLEHGNLILKNISFSLKDSFLKTAQEECDRLEFWFMYVATYHHILVASKAVCFTGENQLHFSEHIALENLVDDFKITIDVYMLRLRKKQVGKLNSFPALRKLRWFNSKKKQMQQIQTSQFFLIGSLHLHRHDLKSPCWVLTKNFSSSPLQGYVDMSPSISLKLKMEYTGFLCVLTESRGFLVWQRQWCQLSEYNIKYWNYPNHQDNTIPVGIVDLRKCVTDCIRMAPRELCARPNTLMLETIKPASGDDTDTFLISHKSTYTVTRHFFSADNREQLDAWCEKMNYVVNVLKTWNVECNQSIDL